MKRFVGGNDGRVFVLNPGIRELGTFEWATKPPTAKARELAKAMLVELFDGDEGKATRFYLRFMHRMDGSAVWKNGQSWSQTETELLAIVKTIEQAEREGAQMRAQADRELPMVQPSGNPFPGATGYGSRDNAPDRRRK